MHVQQLALSVRPGMATRCSQVKGRLLCLGGIFSLLDGGHLARVSTRWSNQLSPSVSSATTSSRCGVYRSDKRAGRARAKVTTAEGPHDSEGGPAPAIRVWRWHSSAFSRGQGHNFCGTKCVARGGHVLRIGPDAE